MAIVNNGTIVNIPAAQLPSYYAKPTDVIIITDYNYLVSNFEIEIAKTDVVNSDPSVTFENIVDFVTEEVTAKITDEYDNTNTVTCYAVLTTLLNNQIVNEALYTNDAAMFYAILNIFVKVV